MTVRQWLGNQYAVLFGPTKRSRRGITLDARGLVSFFGYEPILDCSIENQGQLCHIIGSHKMRSGYYLIKPV